MAALSSATVLLHHVHRYDSTLLLRRLLQTSGGLMKTRKATIRIDSDKVVQATVKGSPKFIQSYLADPYLKRRLREHYRCRSAFKLMEIDDEHQFLRPGIKCIDMGASPGSWSQVAARRIFPPEDPVQESPAARNAGLVIGVDLKTFEGIENVHRIVGDFTDLKVQHQIFRVMTEKSNDEKVDVVICDAATKATISAEQDHLSLVRLILAGSSFVLKVLRPGGIFLFKMRNGREVVRLKKTFSKFFGSVELLKPAASRKASTEIYYLCKNFRNR